jgi:hypothetical protein
MVMATQMLPLRQPSGNRSAVLCTLARQKAVKAVKHQLQARGIRLNDVAARDIHIWADAYLEVHRQELIEQAMEMVSSGRELRKLYEREHRQRVKLFGKLPEIEHLPKGNTTIAGEIVNG